MKVPVCLIIAAVFAAVPVACEAEFRAGAAAVDITPEKLPVSMTGSFQDRMATGVQDPLHARALVLDDGKTKVAFVVCDICLISREIFDAAKKIASGKTGIPIDRMLMSATHTHTAPTSVPLAQCTPAPGYVDQLTRGIAEAVVRANANLDSARIGWGSGEEPDEVSNRRWKVKPEGITANPFGRSDDRVRTNAPRGSNLLIEPAGPVDPEVAFVSIVDREGRPVSLMANYGLHYVGGVPPFQLSADYFGEFARQIGGRLEAGEAFVGILSNGASGDINNYNFRDPRPPVEPMERIRAVANVVTEVVVESRKSIEHQDDAGLAMVEKAIDLGVRKPDAGEIETAKAKLQAAENPEKLNISELYAQETIRIADYPETFNVKLQALRLGEDLGIVAIPCEVFAEIGLEIKKKSPFKTTFVIALANGYNGYLPSPEQHALGGYETWRSGWSYLEVDASRKITGAVLAMLRDLRDGR